MPVKKGEGCIRDVMREWKAGGLRSGKDGPVVTDREQATAIALSMCGGGRNKSAKSYEETAARVLEEARDFAEDCGCKDKKGTKEYDECNCGCKRCKKRVPMAIGYPTPTFSEDEVVGMVRNRLKVIHGRVSEIERVIEGAMMSEGEVEIEQWMIDKITLAADYLSAVADNAAYGDGVEVEEEDGYAEKKLKGSYAKGLTEREQAIAKREAKETQEKAKRGKGAKEVYEDWESDKKYKSRQEKQGKSMPKSKATEAYERMYGKKDSEDMGESGTESALQKKSKESGIPYGILKQVHARGMAAWQTGHRPGVPPQQWAMGRVNSFITGSGGARKADADLWKKAS
jgi:hypothetical protein